MSDTANGRNTIRTWALIAVAVTSVAMIGFGWWLIQILASPNWCSRAIGAAEGQDVRPEYAVAGCFQLLRRQVDALALNSHFALGTLALCLSVLVVIVLAGGRLSFKGSKQGVEMDVGRDHGKVAGARRVERAARQERAEIESEVNPIPATIGDDVADIIPDDDQFEENTR